MKKIFVAEDDQAISEVLGIILREEGFDICTTDTGHNISKKIKEYMPCLIFLDIWLAGYDGGKIAKRFKRDPDLKSIPLIMLSANNKTKKIAQESGAEDFLLKPFTIEDLIRLVHKYTG